MQNAMRRPSKRQPSFVIAVGLATGLLIGAIAIAPAIGGAKGHKGPSVTKLKKQITALTGRVDALEKKAPPTLKATLVAEDVNTAANSTTFGDPQCPAGFVATGGGGGMTQLSVGDTMEQSLPLNAAGSVASNGEALTGWKTVAHNGNSSIGRTGRYAVVCLGLTP
jgi:hypothetical protein